MGRLTPRPTTSQTEGTTVTQGSGPAEGTKLAALQILEQLGPQRNRLPHKPCLRVRMFGVLPSSAQHQLWIALVARLYPLRHEATVVCSRIPNG